MSTDVEVARQGAVARALSVLGYLAQAGQPTRLSMVATDLGLRKSTVHRILASLIDEGYVEQHRTSGCYLATLKLWELGSNIVQQHAIKRAAAGLLQDLHRTTGETVSLSVLSGDDVLYLDKIIAPRRIRFSTRVGSRIPAPYTAGGKAMLAHLRDARERIHRVATGPRKSTCLDVDAVMTELAEVRSLGYASLDHGRGLMSIAAPLMTHGRTPVGALTVSAPSARVSADARRTIIECVLETTELVATRAAL